MDKRKVLTILVFVNVVVIDILVGYLIYDNLFKSDKEALPAASRTVASRGNDLIIEDNVYGRVKEYIDEKIGALDLDSVNSNTTSTPAPTAITTNQATSVKTRQYSYIPIPGSGSTNQNDWTDVSGTDFYFDPSEYPGTIEVRFEANIRLVNGNGAAWVRIHDVTHSITVINTEIQTSSQTTANVTSDLLNFWAGRNLYRIQAKSLTADTTVYEGGRIKVVTEN